MPNFLKILPWAMSLVLLALLLVVWTGAMDQAQDFRRRSADLAGLAAGLERDDGRMAALETRLLTNVLEELRAGNDDAVLKKLEGMLRRSSARLGKDNEDSEVRAARRVLEVYRSRFPEQPPLLGVELLPRFDSGAMVGLQLRGLERSSPLTRAGFLEGDTITQVDGLRISSPPSGQEVIEALVSGRRVRMNVSGRDGSQRTIEMP